MDLQERIDKLVVKIGEVIEANYKASGYTMPLPKIEKDNISDKWCRIVKIDNGNQRSVFAFVCLKEGTTKALGTVIAGDIHKAAGWKAPAKHARGSVFKEDFGNCLTPWGIVYLK